MTPDVGIISDIIAVEIAVFAFFIPLSAEMVSKVSERYHSDVVSNLYSTGIANRILPWLLFVSLVFAILLRFGMEFAFPRQLENALIGLGVSSAVTSLFFAILVFVRMMRFLGDTLWVIRELSKNAEDDLE